MREEEGKNFEIKERKRVKWNPRERDRKKKSVERERERDGQLSIMIGYA